MAPIRSVAAGALALAAALAATLLPPATAHATTAAFTRTSEWPGGYVGSFTVRNDTAGAVTGWRVEFDLPPGTRISSHWSAELTSDGDRHAFTNAAWNGALAPGASTTFGWLAVGSGDPARCTVNGDPCGGGVVDLRSPTAPGDVRVLLDAGVRLAWDPATDAVGVTGYEVYESGRLLATVAEPGYVFSTGGTLPPRVYVFAVRAVDAAGNVSPYGFASLGSAWRTEAAPAAPTGLRVTGAGAQILALAWEPVTPPAFVDPPVAGYEVRVDGVLADRVGGTTAVVPAPGPGSHTVAVRAFNALDLYSAPTDLRYP